MRRSLLAVLVLLAASMPAAAGVADGPRVRVGVGIADDTWHVGAGSGQYADKITDGSLPNATGVVTQEETDPHNHGAFQSKSYGVQSRLDYRTVVIEGNNGERVAFVKSDHYLAQDALIRRTSQILDAAGTSGIAYDDIFLMASHNHSSPYYATPSWGVWLFQDVFDIRAFEYEARQMASSIEAAVKALRPARMGATTVKHYIYKGQIAGATIADDGTPAGYPETKFDPDGTPHEGHADYGLSVVRFDDMTDPQNPKPYAVLANFGQHPESNDGYDLITADFLAPLQRNIARETGAELIFGQGDVGSAEGPYYRGNNDVLPDGVIRAWAHVGHAQTERGARYLANSIEDAMADIEAGRGEVPFTDDFPVKVGRAFVPGPVSHPYPSVSQCRTEPTVEGNPGSPILGLPDCARAGDTDDNATATMEMLKAHNIPVPENYDAPSFTGVQENMRIHIQAARLGEVLFASCSCEAQMDIIRNFESRADDVTGNIDDGYEYPCVDNGNGTWNCQAGSYLQQTVTITDAQHARMLAQIHNDAKGWDDPAYAPFANAEPTDPSQIKGNFTKEELPSSIGYALPIGMGHTGDYNGYVVSYREYMIRDHYRKALTAWGPHTADYMSTWMVALAGSLREGGPALPAATLDAVAQADEVRETAFMTTLGAASSAAYDAWLASLPNDLGPAAAVTQPSDITRFDAATFTWTGGGNAVDNPHVKVQRQVTDGWVDFADQSGEVQTMVRFPEGAQGVLGSYQGRHSWKWTANFEAFDAFPRHVLRYTAGRNPLNGQTPEGVYRFVVDGVIRQNGANMPYHLESEPFEVTRWTGIVASDPKIESDGSVSFLIKDEYPRTYSSSFRYINDDGDKRLCRECSFRPWETRGTVAEAFVRVVRAGGGTEDVPATLSGGRWVAATNLGPGDTASIQPGAIVDTFGEINGAGLTF